MRSHVGRILVVLGCALALVSPGTARAQDRFTRVRDELARTGQRIERATALIGRGRNPAARAELDQATQSQAIAAASLRNDRPRIALLLTLRARGRADRAIALAGGLPDPDGANDQLEHSRELLERARDRTRDCGDDSVPELLRTAADMQAKAEDAAHSGHYLAALQLTLGVRERVRQALRRCNVGEDDRAAAATALRRTDAVLQRVQAHVGAAGPVAADALLAQAQHAQDQAHQLLGDERWGDAIHRTLEARALAKRAQRLAGRD